MKKLLLISFILIQLVCKAEYDSTYVLSVTQKYAIPENVSNGDYVGKWMKTWTWQSVGKISFSIEQNFNSAFSINSSSGLITISDASKINGKVVQQDTIINLIVRTTDSGVGYELDTAQIRVKENAYCVFVDYTYTGTESGSKTQPFNDLDDVKWTTGKMYCLKRGNVIIGENLTLHSLISSAAHPLIICAYGSGSKPEFSTGKGICINMETSGSTETIYRDEYLFFYDLWIRNYAGPAYKVRKLDDHMGWYNCETYNCDKEDVESSFIINTSSNDDSTKYYDFEIVNYYADTTSLNVYKGTGNVYGDDKGPYYIEPSHIKTGVGRVNIINSYFGKTSGWSVRQAGGIASWITPGSIIKHCYFSPQWAASLTLHGNPYSIQIRQDNFTIEDCRITGGYMGLLVTSAGNEFEMPPDNLTVKNCYFSGLTTYGIWLVDNGTGYKAFHNAIIENNIINATIGIRIDKGINTVIRRNQICDGSGNGIRTGTSAVNDSIYYNVIYGFTGDGIYMSVGTSPVVYNNTVDGNLNLSGTSGSIVRNNYFKALTQGSLSTTSNNLDMDTINTFNHFQDYSGHDYRLKSTAFSSIDKGYDVSLTSDITGTSVPKGSAPDIGAYENEMGSTGIPPVNGSNQPPSIANQSFQIAKYSTNGKSVGTVVASNSDAGQTLTYSIVSGNTNGAFTIDAVTGLLSVANAAALDSDFALVVKVQDNGTGALSNQATIAINITLSIPENDKMIKVYPNPVQDELIIEIQGNTDSHGFEILNLSGQIVFKGKFSERTVLPTTNFSRGIYLIKIENGKSFEFKKFVKL